MRWLAVLVLVTAVACGGTKPQCKLEPTPAGLHGPPFLWRAQKAGATVWLFGTIHVGGLELVPRAALDALAASPRIVTELGDEQPDIDVMRRYARIKSGPGLDHQLSADDWWTLRDALRGTLKEDELKRAAPWFAMSLLTRKRSGNEGPTMDTKLTKHANKPIAALESYEDQLKALSSVVTLADLQEAIRADSTMSCDITRMQQAYSAGDTATMTALLVVPRIAETMLYARNRAWVPKLETYVAQGGAFVAVGLGHLLGDQGVPALLAKAGYTVERVPR